MIRKLLLVAIGASAIALPSASFAADRAVSYRPPAFELKAEGPAGLFAIGNRLYVPDPIDDEIVAFDLSGRKLGATSAGFDFERALVRAGRLELFDARGAGRAFDPRAGGPQGRAARGSRATSDYATALREALAGGDRALMRGGPVPRDGRARGGAAAVARTIGGGAEGVVHVGPGASGRTVVRWWAPSGDGYAAYAGTLDAQGRVVERAQVPTTPEFVPEPLLAVTGRGDVFALVRAASGPDTFVPRRVRFGARGAAPERRTPSGASAEVERLSRGFEAAVRAEAAAAGVPRVARPSPITRAAAQSRAQGFLAHRWQLRGANYERAGTPNLCRPAAGARWLRPERLNRRAGETIGALPYRWGGYLLDLAAFDAKLKKSELAGDVCTCRRNDYGYCIVPGATGLDCSGFVSAVWRAPYHSTSGMASIAARIGWAELKAADAVNKAGSHIMLVLGFVDVEQRFVRVVHSAISCGGVCDGVFEVGKLKREGYVPIRYNRIRDA